MRTITVFGHEYKWNVGKKNIVIRSTHPETKETKKYCAPLPPPKTEYAVITWNENHWGYFNARVFEEKSQAEAYMEENNTKVYEPHKPPQLFERQVPVSVTPGYIRELIQRGFAC
jgi:hypothetical protein